jgi:nitroimidazol reductase NimA-like FMN-containing flavoprotein (pyridoxamine 5'-phosphate oxidase superfamily)
VKSFTPTARSQLKRLHKRGHCCLAVTQVDGLVLARSGFHHSIDYRSAMLFGKAHTVVHLGLAAKR